MSLEQTEKLIKYAADMSKRDGEYDFDPFTILSELEEKDTETSNQLREIYDGLAGERICAECEMVKFFDEENSEYYCPVHV